MKNQVFKNARIWERLVVFWFICQSIDLTSEQFKRLGDRHFGVGCDQILLVERATSPDVDFAIGFNSDGGEVEQCGNGARCFVRFVHDQVDEQTRDSCRNDDGIITPRLEDDGSVTVDKGVPDSCSRNGPIRQRVG